MKKLLALASILVSTAAFAQITPPTMGNQTTVPPPVLDNQTSVPTPVLGNQTSIPTPVLGNQTSVPTPVLGNQTSVPPTSTQGTQTPQGTEPTCAADWQQVQQIFSTTAGEIEGNTLRIAIPRNDLTVRKADVQLEPALALTTVINFQCGPERTRMTADMVLKEEEVQPVTDNLLRLQQQQAQGAGINLSALHAHLISTSPPVVFLHLEGTGNANEMANAVKAALALTATPVGTAEAAAPQTPPTQWATIQNSLGVQGKQKGNVLEIRVPRTDSIQENPFFCDSTQGVQELLAPPLGAASEFKFQPVGDRVAATGEFALLAREVNPVARVLNENGIRVEAISNHLIFEEPRLIYVHFWTIDNPQRVAAALQAALGQINSQQCPQATQGTSQGTTSTPQGPTTGVTPAGATGGSTGGGAPPDGTTTPPDSTTTPPDGTTTPPDSTTTPPDSTTTPPDSTTTPPDGTTPPPEEPV
ncbi:DUF1259 domain-containing protein [Geobacter sp. DSM 9736]|uniref:DUF1259 domain-containing protein n=1 Tax=Geobacter sp. DSM 9736 TaxID=1277350 RepID=UPI000B512854|nr:DUF1259 domain-containing protein [Geobacter sp. DSM 9736]SNB44954.1 protein of unknown function [Geobacter sp. DSM 9736]